MAIKIPDRNFTKREETVLDILNFNDNIESFLNIGFRDWHDHRSHWWIDICKLNSIDWNIMEIFPLNVHNSIAKGCPKENINIGNILDTETYNNYDAIMFWHGPEHIRKDIFFKALPNIESKANKLIIFGMPLGEEKQGAVYGNPYEEHIASYFPEEFKRFGYNTKVVEDRKPGHFTAWKNI